jgi:uncharacterized membrane protein YtjA (UPF0391 family)
MRFVCASSYSGTGRPPTAARNSSGQDGVYANREEAFAEGLAVWHVALVFFLTALIAALVAFTGVAGGAATIARFWFVFFWAAPPAIVVLDELVKAKRHR